MMELIKQSWTWLQKPVKPLDIVEAAGRTCYKSEGLITDGSAEKFTKMIVGIGHETVIEHVSASVRFITNRGVTHELVRHRPASYSQESTRYVKYDGGMQFIIPVWWYEITEAQRQNFIVANTQAETAYLIARKSGQPAEQAREVLPNSLKTEVVMTCNLREWRHVFNLRCSQKAHPQIRGLMLDCLEGFHDAIPVVFDDLAKKYLK